MATRFTRATGEVRFRFGAAFLRGAVFFLAAVFFRAAVFFLIAPLRAVARLAREPAERRAVARFALLFFRVDLDLDFPRDVFFFVAMGMLRVGRWLLTST
ncbi:MAG: hypothetical protein IRY91_16055 [Gemmatimonadaceae bacterium]|nr:hypothetical protein [Gemmatimonadaceae bacterium]